MTWTLWVPSPQFQVTDPPGATVTSVGPKAVLAIVTSAAFAVAGRRLSALAARAAMTTWRKDMAAKLGRRRWQPPSSIRRRTLAPRTRRGAPGGNAGRPGVAPAIADSSWAPGPEAPAGRPGGGAPGPAAQTSNVRLVD